MLATLVNTALIVFGIALYVSAGRAHWRLMDQADARLNPQAHARCELGVGLARGDWLARSLRTLFIAFWPAWIAAGFALAAAHGRGR
jgi:hypothetical protein